MRRDQEIERLVKYAEGMGVKVRFSKKHSPDDAADWTLDGTEITIYKKRQKSKTDTILSLVHEIAHTLDHIHRKDRQTDEAIEEAFNYENDEEVTKRHRKRIYNLELQGTKYWYTIYKETNLQIPLWKVYSSMEFDLWQYEFYVETGKFPRKKDQKVKSKEIKDKHKKINYE